MPDEQKPPVAIFGGGPAGLMAADVLSSAGHNVTIHEAMPTVGRKFLLAGKSGLNITHGEDRSLFSTRFGASNERLAAALDVFPNTAVRHFADSLGAETFIGSSGRIFPRVMKASPLLRAWLRRLADQGVEIRTRHRWLGFDGAAHRVMTPEGEIALNPKVALLAFGGASWPKLGSDGGWAGALASQDVTIHPFRPANCGFDVEWSEHFRDRFAGAPIRNVIATSDAGSIQGEFVVSQTGIEGSLVYAHSAALRDRLEREGTASLLLDLAPGRSMERLESDLQRQPAKLSLSNRLRKAAGLDAVKAALIRECTPQSSLQTPAGIARAIKALEIGVERPRPVAEAISSAGGVAWEEIDQSYMLRKRPGVFVAGEMVDWEAPTGGYLLTACLATGKAAGEGMLRYLEKLA